jgi:NAD(P)-dependent dehydrogenase (short-subunit alcohol dehydrogenase family)
VFNNAGIDPPDARSVTETSEEMWDHIMTTNVKSIFLVSKYAIPQMIQGSGGAIVNTASIAGLVGTPAEAAYCPSKGAVVLLTKQMAIDYAPRGIRVNCVCPGAMKDMMRDRRIRMNDEELRDYTARAATRYPLGRYGEPEDVARAVLFLASADAAFITGTALVIDGGYTAR